MSLNVSNDLWLFFLRYLIPKSRFKPALFFSQVRQAPWILLHFTRVARVFKEEFGELEGGPNLVHPLLKPPAKNTPPYADSERC